MNRDQQRIGWLLAVVFLFGGIIAPLAHDGLHALVAEDVHASADHAIEYHADKSDCELCEITLVAADSAIDQAVSHLISDALGGFVSSVLVVDLPFVKSRAPPATR